MDISEAINLLEAIKFWDIDELAKIKAVDMAIATLQEQKKRENQFRVPSKEEWMETYCTPQQFAGYLKRKQDNNYDA
jgi:hypothetical protein